MTVINAFAEEVVSAIRSVVGTGQVALHEPSFEGNEWLYLRNCLDTTFVSSVGQYVTQFENDLSKFTGAKHVVAVVNGTAALHVALKVAGVQAGDEVLLPALNFVAAANAVTYCFARPHFVDSEEITYGIDVNKLRQYLINQTDVRGGYCINRSTGNVIRAIVPMHVFGHPCDLEGILTLANEFNLAVIEDAAEAIGSSYKGGHVGTFGLLGTLSFNGNKTITTGGGGAILTNDEELAKLVRHLTTTSRIPHEWELSHDLVGFNYRMPNLNAALGCAQLEQLPNKLFLKRKLYDLYREAFSGFNGLKLTCEPANSTSNYWLHSINLHETHEIQRDEILRATNSTSLMTRPVWTLMHKLKPFEGCTKMNLSTAESLSRRLINIPSSPDLVASNS